MCSGTIRFCDSHFSGGRNALEFGSGRSTRWFAKRVDRLTSVEHAEEWHRIVSKELQDEGVGNVDYLHIPLDHLESAPEQTTYDPIPAYVRAADRFDDGTLDFVIVDGHYRTHCVRRALPKLRRGGYLLVDDVNMWPNIQAIGVPDSWRVVDDSTNGIKRCLIWQAS